MTEQQIYEMVEEYVSNNLKGVPFDKGLPHLQKFVWDLGDRIGKTGPDVLKAYFDIKSKNMNQEKNGNCHRGCLNVAIAVGSLSGT